LPSARHRSAYIICYNKLTAAFFGAILPHPGRSHSQFQLAHFVFTPGSEDSPLKQTYDLFSGAPEEDVLWLEAVDGLNNAIDRMTQRSRENPGRYFVYSAGSQAVVASIDTNRRESDHVQDYSSQ